MQERLIAFCAVDLRPDVLKPGRIIRAATLEQAGVLALGEKLNRHGQFAPGSMPCVLAQWWGLVALQCRQSIALGDLARHVFASALNS